MVAVAVTRKDLSVEELRAAARRARDTKQGLRILAIAMVLDGHDRHEAAKACGMDRQTLRDRVHRYTRLWDRRTSRPRPQRAACDLEPDRTGGGQ
jgi:hypothetical protein